VKTGYPGAVDGLQSSAELAAAGAAAPPPSYLEARAEFAFRFLRGTGLEIGALNWPIPTPPWATVDNVDRMTSAELREAYREMADADLAEVDLVDNGERLDLVEAASQDFIVANHFLEHTGDPIGTIATHLDKLRPGGILFYAVPDKRFTFDFRRETTSLEHMVRDHEEGPEGSRRGHYDEWGLAVLGTETDRAKPDFHERAKRFSRELEDQDISIHTHTFTTSSFLGLLLHCRERCEEGFEIEAFARHEVEVVAIIRKAGDYPAPAAPPETAPELASEVDRLAVRVAQVEVDQAQIARELERVKRSSSWRVTEPLRAAKARLGGHR
jgi:SAM-dependent methyltransferase